MKVFLTVISRNKSESSISDGERMEKVREMVFPSRLFLTVGFLSISDGIARK